MLLARFGGGRGAAGDMHPKNLFDFTFWAAVRFSSRSFSHFV
jgi:hypothetical protein